MTLTTCNQKIVAGTGHRPHKLGNEYDYCGQYSDHIREELRRIFKEIDPDKCISGMAIGFDTLLTQVAIEMEVPVIAALPFIGQESRWPSSSKKLYNDLLRHPLVSTHVVCEGPYASAKMQIRNEWMVDTALEANHAYLITCWDGTQGGTMNCVRYAQNRPIEIIPINPNGWKKRAEEQPLLF